MAALNHAMLRNMSVTIKREIARIHFINATLVLFVGAVALRNTLFGVELAFLISTGWMALLLITPRLRKVAFFERYDAFLLAIARNSKWIGIWTALWFLLHFGAAIALLTPISTAQLILGGLMSAIFITLLLLSNSWSYAHVKWWKHINMAIWTMPSLGLQYTLLTPVNLLPQPLQLLTACIYAAIIALGISGLFVQKPDYFARIRLGLVLGGLLLGAIIAVYF
jgi:hypothetical protein